MPHFIAECTTNIREQADLPGLFGKVNEAFSYLIERWTDITELRSIYKRLTEFEESLAAGAQ